MSCGCGGIPPSINVRLEAARLALSADPGRFTELAAQVLAFVVADANLADLDRRAAEVPQGSGQEGVQVRSALLNEPVRRIAALSAPAISRLVAMRPGLTLGELAQTEASEVASLAGNADGINEQLAAYGLRLGMDTDALRQWVLGDSKE